jgi:CheY-like chemotaxis protein
VLLVEDDEQVRKLATRTLRRFGYTVLEAANGQAALAKCEQVGTPIDLVITDVVMPVMSGKELVDRLGKIQPGARVLFMSGYTPDAIVHRGVLARGTHMLQKPFTPQQLGQKVREALDAEPPKE